MNLSAIFSQLTTGEFSQLSIGGAEQGQIVPANYRAVVNHVNLGLAALHTRFLLKEGSTTVPLVRGTYLYTLPADLMKLEKVTTALGAEVDLNDSGVAYSCFTPKAGVLRVAEAVVDQNSDLPGALQGLAQLKLTYRAGHPLIEVPADPATLLPEEVEVDLPYSHLTALLLWVASRASTPGGMVGEFNAGNNYFAKYEAECQRLQLEGLGGIDGVATNTRLQRGGWA